MSSIIVRRITFQFPDSTPRYWLEDSPFKTHLMNSFTLLFPSTEKWAIRTLKKSLRLVSNSEIKQDILNFIGQEGQHANAHILFWNNLDQQGYKTDWYFQSVNDVLKWFESNFSIVLNVSILAGFEHLTECIADFGLRNHFLDKADPDLKLLFEWHAAEEIEHKTVAYDALNQLNKNYMLRIIGLIVGHVYAIIFLGIGTFMLLRQDQKLWNRSVWLELIQFFLGKEKFLVKICANFAKYFRVDFHPSQIDNAILAQTVTEPIDKLAK